MKKFVLLALCLLIMASGAFGLEMALGGGALFHSIEGNFGPGAFVFFGASQYLELNVGFSFYSFNFGSENLEFQTIQFGVYGKYPIPISDTFVFFPTAGIDYEMLIGMNEDASGLLWLRGGVGLDVFFTERLFLRGHAILGYAVTDFGDGGFGWLAKIGIGFML